MSSIRALLRQVGRWRWLGLLVALLALSVTVSLRNQDRTLGRPLRPDERLVLFATAAHLTPAGDAWLVPIHGWVYQPETDDVARRATLATVVKALGLEPSSAESALLKERLGWFLVDNERGKQVTVRVADIERAVGPTEPDGHFRASIVVPREAAAKFAKQGTLQVEAAWPAGLVLGTALLVEPTGLSVISDIDDTVKISNVLDKRALLRNTLLLDFRPVGGMPELYRRFAERGAAFHYVSSSPWQLYPPLTVFARAARLPEATFELRRFRLKDRSVFELFGDPRESKPPVIEGLLETYPGRRFCLVGDSGEKDPEVYGEVARRHPGQIACIFIRNVTGEASEAPRFRQAFRGVEPGRWRLFTDPGELSLPP